MMNAAHAAYTAAGDAYVMHAAYLCCLCCSGGALKRDMLLMLQLVALMRCMLLMLLTLQLGTLM